jgi:hypothetical protein
MVVTEDAVKAAYLYKFASYVDWPSDSPEGLQTPLAIGVLGAPDFASELASITANRQVNGRSIVVRALRSTDALENLHVLFIDSAEADRLDQLLSPTLGRPILTVTESVDALTAGSIINFVVTGERVRFEISLAQAELSGLRLDSRLLAVAENVRRTAE